jgi:hypothetical protein
MVGITKGDTDMNTDQIIEELLDRKEAILKGFDFQAVHDIMKAQGWTWAGDGTPSISALRLTAAGLLNRVIHSELPCSSSRTGRLMALKMNYPPSKTIHLELYFIPISQTDTLYS